MAGPSGEGEENTMSRYDIEWRRVREPGTLLRCSAVTVRDIVARLISGTRANGPIIIERIEPHKSSTSVSTSPKGDDDGAMGEETG